ncbi:hypothetical protein BC830DRAFT_394994 [Chytriomyces sp. MP71]|nr:hypothetical protein BC830DRAFT_394994 [Chytriomyces sp. MP71]
MDLLAAASTLSHRAPMSVSVPDNSQSERDAALCCENSHTTSELAPIVDAKPEPACESAPASVSHSLLATLSSQSQHSATFQPPKPSMMHQLPQPTPSPAFIYPQLCTSLPAASLQNWNISGLSAATFSPVPNATPPFHPVPIPAPPSSSSSQCANNVTKKRPGRKCTNEEPANKRIAQNRIAQKNHRERKLQYTQNLEAQVQNLTTLLHQSRGEVAGLCTYVQHLKASSACIHSCIKSARQHTANPSHQLVNRNSMGKIRISTLEVPSLTLNSKCPSRAIKAHDSLHHRQGLW